MGYYITFLGSVALERDTPPNVIRVLHNMVGNVIEPPLAPEECPAFWATCQRGEIMLRMNNAYPGSTYSVFMQVDENYYLSWRSNFKNYDAEASRFLAWLSPWIDTIGWIAQTVTEDDGVVLFYRTIDGIIREKYINLEAECD